MFENKDRVIFVFTLANPYKLGSCNVTWDLLIFRQFCTLLRVDKFHCGVIPRETAAVKLIQETNSSLCIHLMKEVEKTTKSIFRWVKSMIIMEILMKWLGRLICHRMVKDVDEKKFDRSLSTICRITIFDTTSQLIMIYITFQITSS